MSGVKNLVQAKNKGLGIVTNDNLKSAGKSAKGSSKKSSKK